MIIPMGDVKLAIYLIKMQRADFESELVEEKYSNEIKQMKFGVAKEYTIREAKESSMGNHS